MRAILTYHSIDASGSPISVHPEAFDRHVAWLSSGRVRVATISEVLALPATDDAVAVTFDDGFVNFETIAAPRLLAHGCPVTLFVVSDHAGRTNAWQGKAAPGIPELPLLSWPVLARLREQGVTLGAHSRTHADLTRVDPAAVEREMAGSADIIARETGVRPDTFAYPYGRTNALVSRLAAASFRHACTTEFRTLGDVAVPVELPRLDMFYFQHADRLAQWGSRSFARFVTVRHQLRRVRQALSGSHGPRAKL